MGSSASKAARPAGAAARQYPTRTPTSTAAPPSHLPPAQYPNPTQPGPTVRPRPQASSSRSEAINLDASDPDFAASLRSLGAVQPNPTLSNTSSFSSPSAGPDPRRNPALMVLDARQKLQDEAEQEFLAAGRRGHEGRQFLDVYTIRQVLQMRDQQGRSAGAIEKALGLRKGVVERLGVNGAVGLAGEMGRADREVHIV